MTPDSLPCLIAVVVAFAAGAWADHVFRPARRVVDHRSRGGIAPRPPKTLPESVGRPDPPPKRSTNPKET